MAFFMYDIWTTFSLLFFWLVICLLTGISLLFVLWVWETNNSAFQGRFWLNQNLKSLPNTSMFNGFVLCDYGFFFPAVFFWLNFYCLMSGMIGMLQQRLAFSKNMVFLVSFLHPCLFKLCWKFYFDFCNV